MQTETIQTVQKCYIVNIVLIIVTRDHASVNIDSLAVYPCFAGAQLYKPTI